jgi:hypothetical protein
VIFGPSFDEEIFFLTSMVVLLDYSSIGTVFQILLRQVDFRVFLMVVLRRIILAIFGPDATASTMDSYTRLSSDVDQDVRFLFPGILVLVLSADVG